MYGKSVKTAFIQKFNLSNIEDIHLVNTWMQFENGKLNNVKCHNLDIWIKNTVRTYILSKFFLLIIIILFCSTIETQL